MKHFVIFKKQPGEIKNAYSLVDDQTLPTIPKDIVLKVVDVEDKAYTKEELEVILTNNL